MQSIVLIIYYVKLITSTKLSPDNLIIGKTGVTFPYHADIMTIIWTIQGFQFYTWLLLLFYCIPFLIPDIRSY